MRGCRSPQKTLQCTQSVSRSLNRRLKIWRVAISTGNWTRTNLVRCSRTGGTNSSSAQVTRRAQACTLWTRLGRSISSTLPMRTRRTFCSSKCLHWESSNERKLKTPKNVRIGMLRSNCPLTNASQQVTALNTAVSVFYLTRESFSAVYTRFAWHDFKIQKNFPFKA